MYPETIIESFSILLQEMIFFPFQEVIETRNNGTCYKQKIHQEV